MPDAAGATTGDMRGAARAGAAVEGRGAWIAAGVSLGLLSISYGSPLLVVVGLKPITEDLGTARQVVALAAALTWVGTGLGGILMGWIADRIGIRRTVIFGAAMIAAGLALSATGKIWALYIGQGVLLGLLGNGAMFPPLIVYVSRWFDQRRGTALALISSGQYIAGMVWPSVFERMMAGYGWQATMLFYAGVAIVLIPPLAALYLHPAPIVSLTGATAERPAVRREVLGLRPNLVLGVLCAAGFCCCVPMALPQSHLVAFCTDVGVTPALSAVMLSVLQACDTDSITALSAGVTPTSVQNATRCDCGKAIGTQQQNPAAHRTPSTRFGRRPSTSRRTAGRSAVAPVSDTIGAGCR